MRSTDGTRVSMTQTSDRASKREVVIRLALCVFALACVVVPAVVLAFVSSSRQVKCGSELLAHDIPLIFTVTPGPTTCVGCESINPPSCCASFVATFGKT